MDFSNIQFRCSSLGYLMTEPRTKGEGLSETTKGHLIDIYVHLKYQRQDDIQNRYLEKGTLVEEDAITLISRLEKKFYIKNEEHLSNKWIKGTPDVFEGEAIRKAEKITDTKSSWDIYSFHRVMSKALNKIYYWQGQGYMDLTGAKKYTVSYCLVNTPPHLIDAEKRKLAWSLGVVDPDNHADYIEACREIEKNFIYDIDTFKRQNPHYDLGYSVSEWKDLKLDIPMEERNYKFDFDRDDADIMRMHKRVEECRIWLKEFDAIRSPSKLAKAA